MTYSMLDKPDSALSVLQQTFGYDRFRGQQAEIIDTVMSGTHALVLMPTGGGKSLCYQVPALLGDGLVIVVSPLIALMQDQVSALTTLGLRAAFLNSSLAPGEAHHVLGELEAGELDILYLAPERLLMSETMAILKRCEVHLFAIDEAHCVSQWGHDFREDYMGLGILADEFPEAARLALTATADQRTRDEICTQLRFTENNSQRFVSSFDRPNIHYEIKSSANRRDELLDFINSRHLGDSGIVYCLTRKNVDQTAEWLTKKGMYALPYHAGMSNEDRARHQNLFLRGESVIIVATIAFGMGIDKPDVRFVAHLNLPRSIEAYYQETGRAGRDGAPAAAWMRYSVQDVINHSWLIQQSEADDMQKRVVRSKLEAMMGFAEMVDCRRRQVLEYFGESQLEPCGNCDNCENPPETYDATVQVQMALSCIYRTGQRYGVKYIIDVLTGEDTDRIRRAGHDDLSTYGIGAATPAREWQGVFRQMIARGLVFGNVENYGVLTLTERARPVLRGEEVVRLRAYEKAAGKSKKSSSKKNADVQLTPLDAALFEKLRLCRLQLSQQLDQPPFMIFADKALLEMVENKPRTLRAFNLISGVGEKKLESFGNEFVNVIDNFVAQTADTEG